MKRILGLDTSTWWCGLALVEQEAEGLPPRPVAELGLQVQRSHADRLLGLADELLRQAGWPKSSLDGFVATRGPGSFTGVRVGLGTIRGLSLAANRPCVGVTTFEALVEAHGPAERERVALIGAGRGELYGARFDAGSSPPAPRGESWLHPASGLAEVCAGESLLIPAAGLESASLGVESASPRLRLAATPRAVAAAAARLALLRGLPEGGESASIAPLYIRPPDAVLKPR